MKLLCYIFIENFFQEYHQSVKQFGSRSGPTSCRAWSGSTLFEKVFQHWDDTSRRRIIEEYLHMKLRFTVVVEKKTGWVTGLDSLSA